MSALDQIWIDAAGRLELPVERGGQAYVHFDGRTLHVAEDEHLDADDTLAQLILHELCHCLVEGPDQRQVPDWGLDNTSERDELRERAAVRLQAHLTGAWGLRSVLFPTTGVRAFFEALPADALDAEPDPSSSLARAAAERAARPPWGSVLGQALGESARLIGGAVHTRTGLPAGSPERSCGDCGWRSPGGLCRQAQRRVRVAVKEPACARWEPAPSCGACGACCRSAYDAVLVGPRERVVRRHPALIVVDGEVLLLARRQDRCAALDGPEQGPFGCAIYADRPRPCRELEPGGRHCLQARRRVGLTL